VVEYLERFQLVKVVNPGQAYSLGQAWELPSHRTVLNNQPRTLTTRETKEEVSGLRGVFPGGTASVETYRC
jgi:hypothetical protein